jgi:hypothetical protein
MALGFLVGIWEYGRGGDGEMGDGRGGDEGFWLLLIWDRNIQRFPLYCGTLNESSTFKKLVC